MAIKPTRAQHPEYKHFSAQIWALNKVLQQHFKDPASDHVSDSAINLALSIKYQAGILDSGKGCGSESSSLASNSNEERAGARFGPIIYLFRQLQIEMKMSIEYISNGSSIDIRLEQLSPSKIAYYDSACPGRQLCANGTGVRTLSELTDWATSDDAANVCWMTGSSGAGKTAIAAAFSHRLEEEKRLAATFFCSRTSFECRQVNHIIPTIAYQLAHYSMLFRHALCKVLDKDPAVGSEHIASQFEWLLKKPLVEVNGAMPKNLVIILDALDECEDQVEAEQLLSLLIKESGVLSIRIFITTRPGAIIYRQVTGQAIVSSTRLHLHQLEKSSVQADIELYLKDNLSDTGLTNGQIEHLTHRSGTLFVYAVTLVRSIRHFLRSASLQSFLQPILSPTPTSQMEPANIDELYKAVLTLVMEGSEEQMTTHNLQLVLMVVLCARDPIGIDTIAGLTGLGYSETILRMVYSLGPLLDRSEKTGLVSTIHPSFSDFIFDEARSGAFFCDPFEYNRCITQKCFQIMKKQLRFNICDLDSSSGPDALVKNLTSRVQVAISPLLSYSCRYWGYHLHSSPWSADIQAALNEFLCFHLLFWMEVMNLKRLMGMAPDVLLKTQQWFKKVISPSDLEHPLEDAHKFVQRFATTPVSQSTPHIYISALLFWPHSNFVSKCYRERIHSLAQMGESGGDIVAVSTWQLDSEAGSIAYSSNGTRAAFGCNNGVVEVRDIYDSTLFTELIGGYPVAAPIMLQSHSNSSGRADTVCSVAFSSDGKHIAAGSSNYTIQLCTIGEDKGPIQLLEGHSDWVLSLAFSPGGDLVASGSKDCNVLVWSAHSGRLMCGPLEGHCGAVSSLIFSPGGRRIASGSWDSTIRVWDPHDGTLIAGPFAGHAHQINTISFSPNGAYLVSASSDGAIGIWDSRNGLAMIGIGVGTFQGHTDSVYSVVFSSDSNYIVSGSKDQTVRIWDASNGDLVNSFYALTEAIVSLAVSPGGRHVVSCSDDRSIQLWRFSDAKLANSRAGKTTHRAVHLANQTDKPVAMHWNLRSDGWIVAKDASLLLWVPPRIRSSLSMPGSDHICTLIGCAGTIEVKLSGLPRWDWRDCYKAD
ncbi:unnamed protein product [Rhizoctonia solani]|uniref:NACHT domain-containing protein n=1 Tax=Rhizoctonia solani TaxID=456999 RepID=A0A8H3C1T2_9AGAM|nr:unnamed protein product [Rhizoctonia solani]